MGKRLNLINKKFGRLIVLEDVGNSKQGGSLWLCKCACGNKKVVLGSYLKEGNVKSCGCLHKENITKNKLDLINQKFGKLLVIKYINSNRQNQSLFLCRCACGNKVIVRGNSLKNGGTKSCSCLQREKVIEINKSNTTHGLSGTKAYKNGQENKRRAKKLSQTPLLTTKEKQCVQEIYSICSFMNEISIGIKWHVDHITPLSKNGLHHPDNLQILEASANLRKYNNIYNIIAKEKELCN